MWGKNNYENMELRQEGFCVFPKIASPAMLKKYCLPRKKKQVLERWKNKILIMKKTWCTVSCAESIFVNDTIFLHKL